MLNKFIKTAFFLAVVGALYYVTANHFFFYGTKVKVRPKASLTLDNTFINLEPTEFRTPRKLLSDPKLREAGVAEMLVEFGVIKEERVERLLEEIEQQSAEEYETY